MKFKYIGPNGLHHSEGKTTEVPVNSYGGQSVMNGDTINLDGHLADKALKNPNYEEVKKPGPKKRPEKTTISALTADKPFSMDLA